MKLAKLPNSPLIDVVIELRFNTQIPAEAFVGFLYSKLSGLGIFNEQIEPLPMADVPLSMRNTDPNLKFQATHKFQSSKYYLNVGPNVLGFGYDSSKGEEYPGWEELSTEFDKILAAASPLISNVERLGVRYVNFSNSLKLVKGLNIALTSPWPAASMSQQTVVFVLKEDKFDIKVTIVEDAEVRTGTSIKKGQIFDLDASMQGSYAIEDISALAKEGHDLIEKVFVEAVSDKLMEKMQ